MNGTLQPWNLLICRGKVILKKLYYSIHNEDQADNPEGKLPQGARPLLPTTTFFQYGNTSKKKTGIFSMGFSKIWAAPDFGGWHIISTFFSCEY